MGVADELARLVAERDAGDLTPEEFEEKKAGLLAHPEFARGPTPEVREAEISEHRRRNRRRALVVACLVVIGLVAWVVISEATIGPARVEVAVASVAPGGTDAVTFSATLRNVGGQTALGQCQVTVTEPNANGSRAGVTPPEPFQAARPIPPGRSETVTGVTIAVQVGDPSAVTARDLSFVCQ